MDGVTKLDWFGVVFVEAGQATYGEIHHVGAAGIQMTVCSLEEWCRADPHTQPPNCSVEQHPVRYV
jgi:hypothetical protein